VILFSEMITAKEIQRSMLYKDNYDHQSLELQIKTTITYFTIPNQKYSYVNGTLGGMFFIVNRIRNT
jgi:hypothetical protein